MVAGEPWQKTGQDAGQLTGGQETGGWPSGTRDDLSPGEIRLEMVQALVEGEPGLEVGDAEVRRGGPTYTIDTLREIRASHPAVEIFLVLGADAAANLGTWREPAEVLALSTLVVVSRSGSKRPSIPAGATVEWVEMTSVDVSSSMIRERVAAGHDPEGTTDAVAHVIERHHLYRGRR